MSESIFGSVATARTSSFPWRSPDEAPTRVVVVQPAVATPVRVAAPPLPQNDSDDTAAASILEAPLHPGETALVGFARKEMELRSVFAALSVMQARALHARLSRPKANDRLAQLFMRLTPDRRARLINFLADARRREAIACHR